MSRSVEVPEDEFGEEFGKAFRADPNSEPANITDKDLPPVTTRGEPVVFD